MDSTANLPSNILDGSSEAPVTSLAEKSHQKYKSAYEVFIKWQELNGNNSICEQLLLDYFNELTEKYKPSSLWSFYSMLKTTIMHNQNIDISKYSRLIDFLKKNALGFKSKKVEVFSAEQINKFLAKAPDERYLAMKTVMVFGLAGGCGLGEITNVKTDDLKVYGTEIIVTIPKTTTKFPKVFPISGEFAKIVQKYMQLRPANVKTDRFFLQYRRGECQCTVIGKNKLAGVPKEIAKFLKLDPKSYSIPSFRLSSAKILASNGGTEKCEEKRHGKLKSTKVKAKGNKQKSFAHKREIVEVVSDVINSPSSSNVRIESHASIVDNMILMSQRQDNVLDAPCKLFYEITNFNEQQTQMNSEPIEPMLPFTIAIMKSKPVLYMGLQQNRFLRLFQLASERTQLSEVKVMLTLRKLCLNEKFEVLGDLFDLDKATTEQYFHESKHILIDLVNILATTNPISNRFDVATEPIVKIEECEDPIAVELITTNNYDATTDMNIYDHDDIKPSWTELSDFYVPEPLAVALIPTPNNYNAITEMNGDYHNDVKPNWTESTDFNVPSDEDSDFLPEDIFAATVDDAEDHHANEKRKKPVKCTICNRSYASHLIKCHIEDMHMGLRNLNRTICGLCFKKFDTKVLLNAHYKDTHGGCSHCCDVCGKLFSSKTYVSTHILTKHSLVKTYLCDTCGEGFPIKSSLTEHVKRKHNDYPHKCSLCDLKYLCPRKLQDHFRARHTDERLYKCEFKGCGKTFKWPSSFKSHKRVHAEDKFECSICLKKFSFKGNLKNHVKNIHNQINNKY